MFELNNVESVQEINSRNSIEIIGILNTENYGKLVLTNKGIFQKKKQIFKKHLQYIEKEMITNYGIRQCDDQRSYIFIQVGKDNRYHFHMKKKKDGSCVEEARRFIMLLDKTLERNVYLTPNNEGLEDMTSRI